MPKVSQRANKVIASPIRKFLPLVLAAEKRGVEIIKLNVGDPDFDTPKQIFQAINRYHQKNLSYAPSPGIRAHVEAWVKYYSTLNIRLKPENIIPTVGGAEGILFSLIAVADPGDEVLVFEPIYSSYKGFAAIANVKLVPITLKIKNNFLLPPEKEILKKINRKTKAIVLINPDNPTGKVWSKNEINKLIRIAKKYNLFIIADETYREISFEKKPISLLKIPAIKNNAIIIDSVSKKFSCPGARIGCVISYNQELMAAILKFAMIRLSAPTLEQYGLIPLLTNPKSYINKINAEYRRRRDVTYAELKKIPGVICQKPQGAFYILAKLPITDTEDFIKFMVTKFRYHGKTVLVTPAENFYLTKGFGKDEIRIAYVLPGQKIKEGITILHEGLKKYLNK